MNAPILGKLISYTGRSLLAWEAGFDRNSASKNCCTKLVYPSQSGRTRTVLPHRIGNGRVHWWMKKSALCGEYPLFHEQGVCELGSSNRGVCFRVLSITLKSGKPAAVLIATGI